MNRVIKLEDISLEIVNETSLYNEELRTKIAGTLSTLGTQALIEVKANTPVSNRVYKNKNGQIVGHLRDYFALRIVNRATEIRFEIYAVKKYNIIHFIEFGTSTMPAQPFIRPAELKFKSVFYKQLEILINKEKKV